MCSKSNGTQSLPWLLSIVSLLFAVASSFGKADHNHKIGRLGNAEYIEDAYDFAPVAHVSQLSVISDEVYDATKSHKLHKRDSLLSPHARQLVITAYNRSFILDLSKRNNLLHPEFKMVTKHASINKVKIHSHKTVQSTIAYIGTAYVANAPDMFGTARIAITTVENSTKTLFLGEFSINNVWFHIKPADTYQRLKLQNDPQYKVNGTNDIVIYSDSSLVDVNNMLNRESPAFKIDSLGLASYKAPIGTQNSSMSCSNDIYNINAADSSLYSSSRFVKRASVTSTSVTTCKRSSKTLYIGVAVDCTYARVIGQPVDILAQVLSIFNTVTSIYETQFYTSIAITDLVIMQDCLTAKAPWNRECEANYTIYNRLSDFSYWRGNSMPSTAGAWHLLTSCSSGNSLGIAWTKELCNINASYVSDSANGQSGYVSGTAVSSISREQYKVVAHELGHNFGANHDCSGSCGSSCCQCDGACNCNAQYIMHPTDASKTDTFSPCSVNVICTNLANGGDACLKDQGAQFSIAANQCGNGVVEPGEECDSDSPCCNKCKLVSGARCDPNNSGCCTSTCQLASSGSVCRPARSACDYAETCTGSSEVCPSDNFISDGSACPGSPSLSCASGFCTSRSQVCTDRKGTLNITGECTLNSAEADCTISCQMTSGGCTTMAGYFTDGLNCGYKGRCKAGVCKTSGGINAFITWGMKHQASAIIISIVIIAAILLVAGLIVYFLYRAYKKRAAQRKTKNINDKTARKKLDRLDVNKCEVSPMDADSVDVWKSIESPQPELWDQATLHDSKRSSTVLGRSYNSSPYSTKVNSPSGSIEFLPTEATEASLPETSQPPQKAKNSKGVKFFWKK